MLGKWAVKLDCKGYYFPGAQVVDLAGVSATKDFTIAKSPVPIIFINGKTTALMWVTLNNRTSTIP